MKILKADEIAPTLAELNGHALYTPAVTTLYTGLRRGELLALPWNNTDLDKGLIHVRVALEETKAHGVRLKEPKTELGERSITLPQIVIDVLREHRRAQFETRMALGLGKLPNDALVFPAGHGGYQEPTGFSHQWIRAVKKLDLPRVTWHGLRHTHASMLIAIDPNVVKICKRLGHANPSITLKTYAHLFKTDDSDLAAAINRMLASK